MAQLRGLAPAAPIIVMTKRFLADAEPALFNAVLQRTVNNRLVAENLLGIHRTTLRKKCRDTARAATRSLRGSQLRCV